MRWGWKYEANFSESRKLIINSTDCFLYCLFKCPAYTHHLTHTLHATTEQSTDTGELLQVPTWYFDNDIVKTRFETSTSNFCNRILDFVEGYVKTELGSDEC